MKNLLIRHQKTNMEWKRRYSSEEYDRACTCYDEADILPIEHPQETGDYTRIYDYKQSTTSIGAAVPHGRG